jgi:hypothetical protein
MDSLLIGFFVIFFVLGHSTLLYFRMREEQEIPISQVLIPTPKKGKFVSYLCIIFSFCFLFLYIRLAYTESGSFSFNWKIFFVMIVIPLVFYSKYIINGMKKRGGKLVFSEPRNEWKTVMLIAPVILFLTYLLF